MPFVGGPFVGGPFVGGPFVVGPIAVAETYPMRQQVLRPHQTRQEMAFAGDDDPEAGHFAARQDGTGPIVGIVSVVRQHPPDTDAPDREQCWRLRGMATAAPARRQGIGQALVAAVVDHAAGRGGTRLWCQARRAAVPFYRAAGFETIGEEWDVPVIGPHVVMWRALR